MPINKTRPNKELQAKLRKHVDVNGLEQTSRTTGVGCEQLARYLADCPLNTIAFRGIEATLASLPEPIASGLRRLPTNKLKPNKKLQAKLRRRIEEESLEQASRDMGVPRAMLARYLADIALDTLAFRGIEVTLTDTLPEANSGLRR